MTTAHTFECSTRYTTIETFYGDEPEVRYVGISDDNQLFGLIGHRDTPETGLRLTHMCYRLDYFKPAECLKWAQDMQAKFPDDPNRLYFFWDAGTTMPEVKSTYEETERVFKVLGLIE